MGDIRILPGKGQRDPTAILECAKSAGLDEVLILGWKDDNFWFGGSISDYKDMVYLMWIADQTMRDGLETADV